jgi:HD-GYP domain-containing protein (c-di-GMP phosphodiesterase class II)
MIQLFDKVGCKKMLSQLTEYPGDLLINIRGEHTRSNGIMGNNSEIERHVGGLDFLCEISKKITEESESSRLITQILTMTVKNLKCSAASLFLIEEESGDLYFKDVVGKATKSLNEIKPVIKNGIAAWVAKHGEPLLVNDVSRDSRFNAIIDKQTGFLTKSILCVPLSLGHKVIGVIEVLNKTDGSDFSDTDLEVLTALASTAALAIDNSKLHQEVVEGCQSTIKALAATIDAKDPYTFGHSKRVSEYAVMGAVALSLSSKEIKAIKYAGILHDIGKIVVDDIILRKPSSLTPEEWAIIRTHPAAGAHIIADVPFLKDSGKLIVHHHEKYDGSGYPAGLRGEQIPLGARIIAIADAFDTMTTDRSYRLALSVETAIDEIEKCKGKHFCPWAAEAFISAIKHQRRSHLKIP